MKNLIWKTSMLKRFGFNNSTSFYSRHIYIYRERERERERWGKKECVCERFFLKLRSQEPIGVFQPNWSKANENIEKNCKHVTFFLQATKLTFWCCKHWENSSKMDGTSNIANNTMELGISSNTFLWTEPREF